MNLIAATFALALLELLFWLVAGGYALRAWHSRQSMTVLSDSLDTEGEE